MRTPSSILTLVVAVFIVVASPSSSATVAASTPGCPGPEICGSTCSLDPYDVPIHCSNGQCLCPPGYETQGTPIVCRPRQPNLMAASSLSTIPPFPLVDCPATCTPDPWGSLGGINGAFDLVAVHGTSPGGEAFMPVWGAQVNQCSVHGLEVKDAGGNPTGFRSWTGCVPFPFAAGFCSQIQDADEEAFNPSSCDASKGCGDQDHPVCTQDFTNAWPFLDTTRFCSLFAGGFGDPARIDFPNNVVVYRAPIVWEDHSAPVFNDDDYTWDLHSAGGELYDTLHADARVHVEHAAFESIDHFAGDEIENNPFGNASLFWTELRHEVDNHDDDTVCCWLRQFVNKNLDCSDPNEPMTHCFDPGAHDPMSVVVGVPSIDCADHPDGTNDSEIHPAHAMAIRIQEYPLPEKWAFFYRRIGNNGFCGSKAYSRCDSAYKLPLSLPFVPAGQILTSADVFVDAKAWAFDGSPSPATAALGSFDLDNGTVLSITLPRDLDGVVGLVTVTPKVDTMPPQITCPDNITTPLDLGKCTASVTFTPTVTDNCSVSSTCSLPSGTAFPIGTTNDTCTATDQAGLSAGCGFTVTTTMGNKCPLAQGYWKTHPDQWAVDTLTLSGVPYTKTQLLGILNSPTTRDASVLLAKPLIAALLNLANGSSPVPICGTTTAADGDLGSCTVPCSTSPKSTIGQVMISDAVVLDKYNNDKLTPVCVP